MCRSQRTIALPATVSIIALSLAACDASIAAVDQSLARAGGSHGDDAAASTAAARCSGNIGAISVEKVDIPAGATCVLDRTRVRGNVFVRRGATLESYGARIDGDIQAEDARAVSTADGTIVNANIQLKRIAAARIVDTAINGDLQLEERAASLVALRSSVYGNLQFQKADAARIENVTVRGDLQLEENRGLLAVRSVNVRGNLQVFKNSGGVSLVDNRVAQSLQCKENRPAPTGSGNIVGAKEDQCARL